MMTEELGVDQKYNLEKEEHFGCFNYATKERHVQN